MEDCWLKGGFGINGVDLGTDGSRIYFLLDRDFQHEELYLS